MKLSELISKEEFTIIHQSGQDPELTGCIVCDLLSLVMSQAQEGNIWLTVQTNVNIVAVCVLTGAACVIVVGGMEIGEETIKKAKEQDVTLLKTDLDAYELACRIGGFLR